MANDRNTSNSSERQNASVIHWWSIRPTISPVMVEDVHGLDVPIKDGTKFSTGN